MVTLTVLAGGAALASTSLAPLYRVYPLRLPNNDRGFLRAVNDTGDLLVRTVDDAYYVFWRRTAYQVPTLSGDLIGGISNDRSLIGLAPGNVLVRWQETFPGSLQWSRTVVGQATGPEELTSVFAERPDGFFYGHGKVTGSDFVAFISPDLKITQLWGDSYKLGTRIAKTSQTGIGVGAARVVGTRVFDYAASFDGDRVTVVSGGYGQNPFATFSGVTRSGIACGVARDNAFATKIKAITWSPTQGLSELPDPPTERFTEAYDINDRGIVTGRAFPESGVWRAVVWVDGTPRYFRDISDFGVHFMAEPFLRYVTESGHIFGSSGEDVFVAEPLPRATRR